MNKINLLHLSSLLLLIISSAFTTAQSVIPTNQVISIDKFVKNAKGITVKTNRRKFINKKTAQSHEIAVIYDKKTNISYHLLSMGVESSGGGSVIKYNGHYVLTDYLSLPTPFKEIGLDQNFNTSNNEQPIEFKLITSINGARDIINNWRSLDNNGLFVDLLTPVLTGSLDVMSFLLVDEINSQNQKSSKGEVIALYSNSKESFNPTLVSKKLIHLNQNDRNGLILHEILRHVQLTINSNFDDKTLEIATAIMLICQPNKDLSNYLFYLVNNYVQATLNNYGPIDTALNRWCKQ